LSRQGEKREATLFNIKSFWENEASEWGDLPQVTIRDHYFRLHEINTIYHLIYSCNRILDIGCGTGFSTLHFAKKAKESIIGVDYSKNMLKWADRFLHDPIYFRQIFSDYGYWNSLDINSGKISFVEADILTLAGKFTSLFDIIVGQRILINLPSHEIQLKALENLRKLSNSNSTLILVEATLQGHSFTNNFRSNFNIPPLEKYWHNNYVDESRFNEWHNAGWGIKTILSFDTYMLLSKVIYPASVGQENCKFLSGANKAAMELSNVFRTFDSVNEIGFENFLELYVKRVSYYDLEVSEIIKNWIKINSSKVKNWKGLGHQKLVISTAI
jgi:SAM-dependent methyltransferase